ncbi:LLM class flavin-dependent oxidoreductase [Kitasatospora sp. SUK 42]|uniref:LLM class flavin-dependent oxidoreductase n=1 Tax=Kitasatospora sp. SUK 42 TaxID=1588882 RepID=UPI0018CAA772|nr:LLM class flavin-dependent oxidoreductase [Kitasatospora sp. SUK 42]MBV2155831.1 LLM class flavin-dependent oxidoreductase [Kitasatospora sp. SUK 42]
MRISVLFPHALRDQADLTALTALASLVGGGAADRLWLGQSLTVESHQALAWLAGTGRRIPVGLSVTLAALRHPFEAAAQARSLAVLTGHRPVIGYGAGEPSFVGGLLGAPYARPAAAVADYVGAVRTLLDDQPVAPLAPDLPSAAPRLRLPHREHPPAVELGAGVLRPAMARAAGRVADVAITWMTPPRYLAEVLVPALAEGAAAARPATPPKPAAPPRVVTVVHAAVARPDRHPMVLAQNGAGRHLRAPHYADMLRRAGLHLDTRDPVAGARELVESGVFLYGSPEVLATELAAYGKAGVDEVVLNPAGVVLTHGWNAALTDLTELLTHVAPRIG